MASSQADAALTKMSFDSSAITARAVSERRALSATHQSSA